MEELERTSLHLAATRPAMVPYVGVSLRLMTGLWLALMFIMSLAPSFQYGMACFVVWLAVATTICVLVRNDHNMPRILAIWIRTKLIALDADKWGGSTVEPCSVHPAKTPRGI